MSYKLLAVHPVFAFKLNNLNTEDNRVNFLQPGYNINSFSARKLLYACAHWKSSCVISQIMSSS